MNTEKREVLEELVIGEKELTEIVSEEVVKKPLPGFALVKEDCPLLRQTLDPYDFAKETNEKRAALVELMTNTLTYMNGMGLSACQIGLPIRVFVMRTLKNVTGPNLEQWEFDENLVCFNPRVLEQSEEEELAREGCLTFPGLSLQIARPKWVEAEFETETGETSRIRLFGINARCYLHELDHMNGILFTTKVSSGMLTMAREKQRKLIKKVMKQHKLKVKVE